MLWNNICSNWILSQWNWHVLFFFVNAQIHTHFKICLCNRIFIYTNKMRKTLNIRLFFTPIHPLLFGKRKKNLVDDLAITHYCYILCALYWSLASVVVDDDDKNRPVILVVVVVIIIIIINRTTTEKKENPFSLSLSFSSFSCILEKERISVYQKNIDRLECLSSHFIERLASIYKRFGKGKSFKGCTYIYIKDCLYISEWRKLVQWCNDTRTEENCVCVCERERKRDGNCTNDRQY